MPPTEQNPDNLNEFLSSVRPIFDKLRQQRMEQSSTEQKLIATTQDLFTSLKNREAALPNRNDESARLLSSIELESSRLCEVLSKNEASKDSFQIRFDQGLVEVCELRVKAFTNVSNFLEKLSILGIGSLGLSITIFSFVCSKASKQLGVVHLGLSIVSWCLILLSIFISAIGQLNLAKLCHELLHKLSDMRSRRLQKDSALVYRQELNNSIEVGQPKTLPLISDSEEPTAIWLQSRENLKLAIYAICLLAAGYCFLLIFIFVNRAVVSNS